MHGLGVFTALHTDSKSLQHRDTWLAAVKNRRRLTKVTKFENILRADKEVLWFNIWKKNEALTICFKCCPTTWIRNMNTRQQYTFFTASVSLLWQYFVLANYSWCVERLNQHAHVQQHNLNWIPPFLNHYWITKVWFPDVTLDWVTLPHLCAQSHSCDTSWWLWWAGKYSCGLCQAEHRWAFPLVAPAYSARCKKFPVRKCALKI